nr:hypothetical protein [Tanacetum cinerariifolium]
DTTDSVEGVAKGLTNKSPSNTAFGTLSVADAVGNRVRFLLLGINVILSPTGRYVVPTGRLIVPTGRYIVPTRRVIVATGRYVVPAGKYYS